jgi:putative transposase
MKYAFIAEHIGQFSVTAMCRVLGVSKSGYHASQRRTPCARTLADQQLVGVMLRIFLHSDCTYGRERMLEELTAMDIHVGKARIARLMRLHGMVPRARRLFKVTTQCRRGLSVMPDLIGRDFTAERPMQLLTGDITYVWTREGWLYLAIVLDVCTRKIIGWATSRRIDTALVSLAMRRALCGRVLPKNAIFHSDRGSQYCATAFREMLRDAGIRQSQGLSCYDNAITETVFHTIKTECLFFESFRTRLDAHRRIFRYIEAFYNTRRRHSALGNLSPAQFERRLAIN